MTVPPLAPAIALHGVTKRFGDQTAVDALDLTVARGVRIGFLGANGSGKTTTIRMVMGLHRPDDGRAVVLGVAVADDPAAVRRQVGYVPEVPRIYRWMTVREVFWFVASLYPRWDRTLCDQLTRAFDLPTAKRVDALSKGMLAKLSLILALVHRPELLVLDEPFSGLDPIARDDVLDRLAEMLAASDMTLFFSSHRIDDVERLATEIAILDRGKLLTHESVNQLRAMMRRVHLTTRSVFHLTDCPAGTVRAVISEANATVTLLIRGDATDAVAAVRSHPGVVTVDESSPGLDEIFKLYVKGANPL